MIKYIIGALILILMLFSYSACVISGRISKMEEENEFKKDI